MTLAHVRGLVGEDGGELVGVEKRQRAGADHDLRPEARQAVRRRARMVDHPHARHAGVVAGDEGEQHAVPAPGAQGLRPRGEQHHDEHGEKRQAGGERGDAGQVVRLHQAVPHAEGDRRLDERAQPVEHASAVGLKRVREHRADGGEAPRHPEGLPEQDGRPGGAPRPPGGREPPCTYRARRGERGKDSGHDHSSSSSVSALRRISASEPETVWAKRVSAAERSPVMSRASSISSATYASRLAPGS